MTKQQKRKKRPANFVPTQAQHDLVSALIAFKMTPDQIRQLVINPADGMPVAKTTLYRHFRRELTEGSTQLKGLVVSKFREALAAGAPWAVRSAMFNLFSWRSEQSAQTSAWSLELGGKGEDAMKISFILPDPQPVEPVPPNPYHGQPADLSAPALPAPRDGGTFRDPHHRLGPWRLPEEFSGTDWLKG